MSTLDIVSRSEHVDMLRVGARLLTLERDAHRFTRRAAIVTVAIMFALVIVATFTPWPRSVILAVPMAGYGLPVCASEDSTPVGGCVWPADDAVWINYPGRT